MDYSKSAHVNHTPNSTYRLFIPKGLINRLSDAFMILDCMSIWGGADVDNENHFGWEFPRNDEMRTILYKIVEKYNSRIDEANANNDAYRKEKILMVDDAYKGLLDEDGITPEQIDQLVNDAYGGLLENHLFKHFSMDQQGEILVKIRRVFEQCQENESK